MKVILKQNVDKLGYKDDVVVVKPGYARNFLIPQGMATSATPSAIKMLEETLRQRSHKQSKVLEEANELAAKIADVKLTIGTKAGETGKIFGSVTSIQVAEALAKAGFEISRKSIAIQGDVVKELGEYTADVKIHRDVTQSITFEVVGE